MGKPGKRGPKPRAKPVAVPLAGIPPAPKGLDAEARKHWKALADLLNDAGLSSALDADAMLFYVTHWSRWRKAEKMLALPKGEGGGEVIETPNCYLQQSPWLTIANDSLRQMKAYLSEFGLSPKARSKLVMPEREEVDDKWKEFEEG